MKRAYTVSDASSLDKVDYSTAATIIESTAVLTKTYKLVDGKPTQETSANMAQGAATVKAFNTVHELAAILKGLKTNQAMSWGVVKNAHPEQSIQVLSRKKYEEQGRPKNAVARTNDFFEWGVSGGVMMLDFDFKGDAMPKDQIMQTLYSIMPKLQESAFIWWCSSSSFIYNGDTQHSGLKGQRIYILVKDASDIERAGKVLFERLWLAGHGHIEISDAGSLLTRSIIDSSVWQPNRLDFISGANCIAPMQQKRPEPDIHDGAHLDTAIVLKDLTAAEQAQVAALKEKAKAKISPEANAVKEQFIESTARKNLKFQRISSPSKEQLDQAKETVKRAQKYDVLASDFVIYLDDMTAVTVGEILSNPTKYNDKLTKDPLEPDYDGGRTVGRLYLLNGKPNLHSQAHGGKNYKLIDQTASDDSAPTFNAWDIKWIYSGLTKAKLIAELETETEQQRIFELSLELANKLSLSYPHVYSKIGIYKTIEHATQEKLKPEILNAIIDRAFYSVEKRHKNALKLVQADNWGKHTVETVETLHGVNIAYSGLIIVNAPTGYFKTEVILKQAVENAKQHDKLSITIAHRVSLIADLCDRLELSSYKEIKANKALVSVIESLGICVHSLALAPFRPFINKVSHVFIDEISQVIRCLADSTLKRHKANAIYDTLRQLIAEAECVIVADANIDQMTLNFLESCRPNETFKIVQVLPVDQGKKAVFCTDENYLLYEVARRLAEGENVWIATDSKAWAESIIASGMLAHAENMLVIDADTKEIDPKVQAFLENPNEESKKYDLIFASPTISSGVSINHNQFNFVAGYFSGKSVSPTDAYQMLGRVRQCKDYMICIPTKPYSDHGEIGVINGIDEIYRQENRQLVVNDFANLYQSIITERENALLAFSESLLWILESKKITIARFTGMANHAESEYALKTTRSQLNDERKQQIIDAPCITEEQAKQIDKKDLKTADDLNALKALKIKISLGYAHTHKLTEADLALNPADLKRFNAFRGLTTVYDESAENPLSQQFNDQRAKAYKEILGNLKPDSTFGREEITAIMSYVVQHRFRFALLGIVSAKLGRIYRDKKGNVKPCTFKSPKEMTQEFFEIIKRLGLRKKDARTKESKNTNAKRLQLSDTVKSVSHVVFNTISNSASETKTERDNLYQLDAESWAAVAIHADRLVLKNNLKPLPIVLEIRKEIAVHVANDADFDWIEPIPIQNIP